MIYHLLYPLHETFGAFNVFRYITFRTAMAMLTALLVTFVLGPWLIGRLRLFQIGQEIREEGAKSHQAKRGTPTMGGLLIVSAVVPTTLLWADLRNVFVWIAAASMLAFGAIGFVDDYMKVARRRSLGLTARGKFAIQIAVALVLGLVLLWLVRQGMFTTRLSVPFFKGLVPDLGWAYPLFVALVLVGSSNAVNLTDGLDGLAIMPAALVAAALGVFAYASGNVVFANYLSIPEIQHAGELLIFCASLAGAGLGFLWFNAYPAQVFMGDIGALAIGAAIGVVAVIVRQEVVALVMGGIFVLETASVILQVASFKLTGKRIFRMAPLHHHFELKGWPEPRVIVRFWIISLLLVLAGLATLKLR